MQRFARLIQVTAATVLVAGGAATSPALADPLLFWSTQGTPVNEQQAIRDTVLNGFDGDVDYSPQDEGPFLTRINAEAQAGKGAIDLIGGLHGQLAAFPNDLIDLSDVAASLSSVGVNQTYLGLGKLGTNEQKYIPWMQATYIMAASKKALDYLPDGADINALTYDQLIAWAKNLADKTGGPKFGLPVGPKGLIHRFVQGYLYPSFTDSMVTKFRSPEAVAMWGKVKELWAVTNPASPSYGFMQEQLLSGEVWVAWDHTARLADAINQKPDDFVAFPAPAGPAGSRFHAGGRRSRHPQDRSRHGRRQEAAHLYDAALDADRHAEGDRLLPGRQRAAAGRHAGGGQGRGSGGGSAIGLVRRQPGSAAGRPRRSRRQVQPSLHRHLPADRPQQPGHRQGARRRGGRPPGDHGSGQGAMLGA